MFSRCTVWMKERCGADGISAMALWKFWFLFGMIVSPFKLRNLVSSSPALLKMLLALRSTNNFSDFRFFLGYGDTQSSQNTTLFIVHKCFHGPKLSSTGVILNIPGRDGKVILVCTLACESPVSVGVTSTWWGQPATWHKDVLPFSEVVIYQP